MFWLEEETILSSFILGLEGEGERKGGKRRENNKNAMRFSWWCCRRRQSRSRGTGPAASNALHKPIQEAEEGR